MGYQDILYEVRDGVATITINRPEVYNAFRAQTCEELLDAFNRAGWDRSIAVIVFTGAGEKAFCTGGDQKVHDGKYDGRGMVGLPIEEVHGVIRDVPKPVIARVRGFAIGGGNVLAVICDLTIASENAVFGQVGPKVGSVDPGFGTAYLARVVGEKKARELWYLCRRYTAKEALEMGLVDEIGGFDQALEAAAQLGGGRPRPLLVQPKRSFSDRFMGRAAAGVSGASGFDLMTGPIQRLLSGGIYYLEPTFLMGDYSAG